MFKLFSLSSPTGLFERIDFKDGLNIILGKYSKSGKDINGIGKSTIVNLIDYCLLADGVKSDFFNERYSFIESHRIKLEFVLGTDKCSIERGFSDKRTVYYQKNDDLIEEYLDTDLRLIIGAEMGRKQEGVYDPRWYRTLMQFFVQNDHNFIARNSENVQKFTVGKRQPELLTFIFLLLGVDNSLVYEFDKNNFNLKALRADQSRIQKQIFEQTGKSVEDFRGECDSVSRKIEKLEDGLDKYEFTENKSQLEEKLHELNSKISTLTKRHLGIRSNYEEIRESLEINVDVDTDAVADMFHEINLEFSNYVKKNLNEVLEFRNNIATNRNRFLKERESQYQDELTKIAGNLILIEKERAIIYKMLDEKLAFDALKSAYNNIVEEKSSLSNHLAYLDQLDRIEQDIATKKSIVGNTVAKIVSSKSSHTEAIDEIKDKYMELVENSVDIENADVNPYFNIEFKAQQNSPVQIKLEVPRGSSLGKSRFKILAFDLTVFITSVEREASFPSFLIHDGVFHAIAHKTRIKFLNYINEKLNSIQNAQYIITVNEDEITFPEQDDLNVDLDFDFDDKTIITLGDKPESMLFGQEFG